MLRLAAMRALARSHQQPAPENKTCRLFGAARRNYSMRAAIGVNYQAEIDPVRETPVSLKKRIAMLR
jgi:hypothetical protein